MDWDTIVIGAGAAGMLAAIRAGRRGRRALLLEKNRKVGVKILMSGGTRCNLTHDTDPRGIVEAFGSQGKFLHSALARLGPSELVSFFHSEGIATKIEATGKVFPVSDRALDVQQALLRSVRDSGVELRTAQPVTDLTRTTDGFCVQTPTESFRSTTVIVTTGGRSYPGCGTTGDGYNWLSRLGHTIVPPCPALVPLTTRQTWVHQLAGITVPDVAVQWNVASDTSGAKPVDRRRGSFLFTHRGLSGPVVMDISRELGRRPEENSILKCNFLPDSQTDATRSWLAEQATLAGGRPLAAALPSRLPRRLIESLFLHAQVPLDRKGAELSKRERQILADLFHGVAIPISGSLGFAKAEVTAGGVALGEVQSQTMQSKIVSGLYLAGEILDLDGPIGGYNFQAAFSTGWLAGSQV